MDRFDSKIQEYENEYDEKAELDAADRIAQLEYVKRSEKAGKVLRKLGKEASRKLIKEKVPQLPVFRPVYNAKKPDKSYASKIGDLWVAGQIGYDVYGNMYRQPDVVQVSEESSLIPGIRRKIVHNYSKRYIIYNSQYKKGDAIALLGSMNEDTQLRMHSIWNTSSRYTSGIIAADDLGMPVISIVDREYGSTDVISLEETIVNGVAKVIADCRRNK